MAKQKNLFSKIKIVRRLSRNLFYVFPSLQWSNWCKSYWRCFCYKSRTLSIPPNISEISEQEQWYGNFEGNTSRKSEIYWNIRNANHLTKNSGTFRSKLEWNGNFREVNFQHLGTPREFVFFTEILGSISVTCSQPEHALPFTTGNVQKFRPEFLVEWIAP